MIIEKVTGAVDNAGIAYTYNEPTVYYEFMLNVARIASEGGLKNVMVTNGFINPEPLDELLNYMDAFNVDLKAFTNDFYRQNTGGKLEPVLDTIKRIHRKGKHLELTNLIITDLNDNEDDFLKMVQWISQELSPDIPFHISRYFPVYKLENRATEISTLQKFYEIARKHLHYVYLGNVLARKGQDTFCPGCQKKIIERTGYSTYRIGMDKEGSCKFCGKHIMSDI
jgi:pyruvate formate lyase activating enzyme